MLAMVCENVLCLKLSADLFRNAEFLPQIFLHLLWLEMVILSQLISSTIHISCKNGLWCDNLKCIKDVPWLDCTDCVFSNIRSNKTNNYNDNSFFLKTWGLSIVILMGWTSNFANLQSQFEHYSYFFLTVYSSGISRKAGDLPEICILK